MRLNLCLAAVVALSGGSALAAPHGSCGDMIGGLQSYLDQHPEISGTRRQTKDAQLMHQPTRDSVAKAKSDSRDNLHSLLEKARARQAAGDVAGCRDVLAEAQRMLKF